MQNAAIFIGTTFFPIVFFHAFHFVDSSDVDEQLLFKNVNFLIYRKLLAAEQPRLPESGTSYHHGIYAVAVECGIGIGPRANVTIADDGNVDVRIVFHFADKRPVGIAGVHLRAGAAVNGQCLYAAIL